MVEWWEGKRNVVNPSLAVSPKPFATRRQKRMVSSSVRHSVSKSTTSLPSEFTLFSQISMHAKYPTNKQHSEGGSEKNTPSSSSSSSLSHF